MPYISIIDDIKDSIVRSNKLFKDGVPIPLDENTANNINCYAYALGIMYIVSGKRIYLPGFSHDCQTIEEPIHYAELFGKICLDLRTLNISFRIFNLKEPILLKSNEYLIKVFESFTKEGVATGNFHFIRRDSKTGLWFHKLGWMRQPDLIQSDKVYGNPYKPGIEPDLFTFRTDDDEISSIYKPIGYFAITERTKEA